MNVNNLSPKPESSIPKFHTFIRNIEAYWQHIQVDSISDPLEPLDRGTDTSESPSPPLLHKRINVDKLPLSASSSRSTDVIGRKSNPLESIDEDRSIAFPSSTTLLQPLRYPPVLPSSASPSSSKPLNTHPPRNDYWHVVMNVKSHPERQRNEQEQSHQQQQKRNCYERHEQYQLQLQQHQHLEHQQTLQKEQPKPQQSSPMPSLLKPHATKQAIDGEKPFACHSCPLRFRKRCNLMTHISNVHEKIRPFYCSLCLRRFARKSNCAKHVSQSFSNIANCKLKERQLCTLTFALCCV